MTSLSKLHFLKSSLELKVGKDADFGDAASQPEMAGDDVWK